jgi:hypothetical protein
LAKRLPRKDPVARRDLVFCRGNSAQDFRRRRIFVDLPTAPELYKITRLPVVNSPAVHKIAGNSSTPLVSARGVFARVLHSATDSRFNLNRGDEFRLFTP